MTFIEPRKGCDLTMQLDLPLLSSHISKASIVTHLSSMYALVVGTPLRWACQPGNQLNRTSTDLTPTVLPW